MVNKYLLLFVASFFSLNLIAAEVNLDRIINEIPGGCSDEVIDYLKNPGGSEDIIGELITDTLTSACITHNEPEESIEMMQSVKNRIVRLEIPEDTDPNLIDLAYGMYAVTWFEPFLASGLIQEAENLFLENLKFFNQLKSEKKIKPFTEMIGRHQFLVAHYETTEDTAYFINGLLYMANIESFFNSKCFINKDTLGYLINGHQTLDIDKKEDLEYAKYLIKKHKIKYE